MSKKSISNWPLGATAVAAASIAFGSVAAETIDNVFSDINEKVEAVNNGTPPSNTAKPQGPISFNN